MGRHEYVFKAYCFIDEYFSLHITIPKNNFFYSELKCQNFLSLYSKNNIDSKYTKPHQLKRTHLPKLSNFSVSNPMKSRSQFIAFLNISDKSLQYEMFKQFFIYTCSSS